MDQNLRESVKQVETACSWYTAQFTPQSPLNQKAKGLAVVAKALRVLMIMLEQHSEDKGVSEAMIAMNRTTGCPNHDHLYILVFNSRGEFAVRYGLTAKGSDEVALGFQTRTITIHEVLNGLPPHFSGVPAEEIIGGIQLIAEKAGADAKMANFKDLSPNMKTAKA